MPAYKNLPDAELTALLKQGDEGAFTEIYKSYSMTIYYRVNQLLRDSEASKDIVHEIFMTLWDKSQNTEEQANLAGYLYFTGNMGFWFYYRLKSSLADMRSRIYGYLTNQDFKDYAFAPLKVAFRKFRKTFFWISACYLAIILLVLLSIFLSPKLNPTTPLKPSQPAISTKR